MTAESRLISALAFGPGNLSGSMFFSFVCYFAPERRRCAWASAPSSPASSPNLTVESCSPSM